MDHERRARSNDYRLNSAWFGQGAQLKNEALEAVVALAACEGSMFAASISHARWGVFRFCTDPDLTEDVQTARAWRRHQSGDINMRELTESEIDGVAGGVVPFALIGVGLNLAGRVIMSPAIHHLMRSAGLISGTYQAAVWASEGRIERQ